MAECADTKEASTAKEEPNALCNPCLYDGRNLQAKTWCSNCKEFLCSDCSHFHRRLAALRQHRLIAVVDVASQPNGEQDINVCKVHPGKQLEYYCQDHDLLCCHLCFFANHRSCTKVVFIPDIATSDTEEFKKLQQLLGKLENGFKTQGKNAKENKVAVHRQHEETSSRVDRFTAILQLNIKELVRKQKVNMDDITTEDIDKLDTLTNDLEDSTSKLQKFRALIKSAKEDTCQLFITMKHIEKELEPLAKKLTNMEKVNRFRDFKFEGNFAFVKVLDTVKDLGYLVGSDFSNKTADDGIKRELYKVCRFKETESNIKWLPRLDKERSINVTTDKDTRLVYVLLYSLAEVQFEVTLDINEGTTNLVHCISFHTNLTDYMFPVKVLTDDGMPGIILKAGHCYRISVVIHSRKPPLGFKQFYGKDSQKIVSASKVKFTFKPDYPDDGMIAGLMCAAL